MAEKKVQAIFRSCVRHYCQANNVSFAGEADSGRGPVDLEFAQGWTARAQIELKLVSSSKFWDGVLSQAPHYAVAADARVVYYVGIAYTDDEMAESITNKVKLGAEIASKAYGVEVRAVIIDTRQQKSASHTKPEQELRDQLHRGGSSSVTPIDGEACEPGGEDPAAPEDGTAA
ncbi:hypothetical protein ACIA5C_45940 [Actinoplanes sp. NPDC051343]|uniref:hypothetical protein n=1 Tax=Actinoplanes sp. NPDC051343 TaxID=3363906 RepID=UPI0037ACB37D